MSKRADGLLEWNKYRQRGDSNGMLQAVSPLASREQLMIALLKSYFYPVYRVHRFHVITMVVFPHYQVWPLVKVIPTGGMTALVISVLLRNRPLKSVTWRHVISGLRSTCINLLVVQRVRCHGWNRPYKDKNHRKKEASSSDTVLPSFRALSSCCVRKVPC